MTLSKSKHINWGRPCLPQIANFPKNVQLISTTRYFPIGAGLACSGELGYADFNLAMHVGDDLSIVMRNRNLLITKLNLPNAPKYLEQTHSNICLDSSSSECVGDAVVTKDRNSVCAIMTADCLPIFAANVAGTQVGVAHAGWKGIVNGIIESFIAKFDQQELVIHFGPAISAKNFEVGQDVFDQFINKDSALEQAFTPSGNKYQLDIYQAASIILNNLGVENISGGDQCTFDEQDKYFSYRRDGAKSGRMAHLIWIK
ncbi:peptidoglycan editing factor PgeF [Candidatus Thioglobus sp.]|uniref:peptidoglycan editing factor PgeF n=1 Tax=Candidatus Thioglobus sp. TaxID=2026721 RepID=UPI003D0F4F5D